MSSLNSNSNLPRIHWEGLFHKLPTKNALDENIDKEQKVSEAGKNRLCR